MKRLRIETQLLSIREELSELDKTDKRIRKSSTADRLLLSITCRRIVLDQIMSTHRHNPRLLLLVKIRINISIHINQINSSTRTLAFFEESTCCE